MNFLCPALLSGLYLPARCMHTSVGGGKNISPPLLWGDVPPETASFAVAITDLDGPSRDYLLWFVANIPAAARGLVENISTDRRSLPPGSVECRNALGELRYNGPAVPRGGDDHRIEFRLWALRVPALETGPYAAPVARQAAVARHAIAETTFLARATRSG